METSLILTLKAPVPVKPPSQKVGDDVRDVSHQEPDQPGRIRCPHCGWRPRKTDLWACHCGCHWHTFDTGGKCPNCGWLWTQTQCQRCAQWAAHLDWYEDGRPSQ